MEGVSTVEGAEFPRHGQGARRLLLQFDDDFRRSPRRANLCI